MSNQHVEYIDHMGSDLTVVNAARVSFDKESDWDYERFDEGGYGKLTERDQKLINYLAKHNHWTPFSHVMIQMRETVPIFVARQRFKHKVGFTENEISRRYVDDAPEFFRPDSWRKKAENKKQGSSDELVFTFPDHGFYTSAGDTIDSAYEHYLNLAEQLYSDMLHAGVAPEQARMILPQSMMTSYYVTGSLAAWARAYKLRYDSHAQKEIQDLAIMWGNIIENIPEVKYSWEALIS